MYAQALWIHWSVELTVKLYSLSRDRVKFAHLRIYQLKMTTSAKSFQNQGQTFDKLSILVKHS